MQLPTQRHAAPHKASSHIGKRGEPCVESSRCCEATTAFSLPNVWWNIRCAHSSKAVTIARGTEIKWLLLVYEEGQWKSQELNLEVQPPATLANNSFPDLDKPSPSTCSKCFGGLENVSIKGNSTEAHTNCSLMRKKKNPCKIFCASAADTNHFWEHSWD